MCSPGLLGFAQKLSFKRGNSDAMGKIANVFLSEISGFKWLLCAMMADGAAEAMVLIRNLDNEDVDVTELCRYTEQFLNHVTWLFYDGGIFRIEGHTSFIVKWFETTHHYVCGKVGMSMGGGPFPRDVVDDALKHMQAWVQLCKTALSAEFPSFAVINCFSVFQLPKSRPVQLMTTPVTEKLQRLAQVFKVPSLIACYKSHWHHAYLSYRLYTQLLK